MAPPLTGLAPRTVRLAAVLADLVVALPLFMIWAISAGASIGLSFGAFAKYANEAPWLEQAGTALAGTVAWIVFGVSSLAILLLTLYQWYLLATRGQTIGKRFVGIHIVDLEGRPAGFMRALVLRFFVFWAISSFAVGLANGILPILGTLVSLLDYVPMMGPDRRCAHDYLAGTQVRWVRVVEVRTGRLVAAVGGLAVAGAAVAIWLNPGVASRVLQWPSPTLSSAVPSAPTAPTAATVPSVPVPLTPAAPLVPSGPAPEPAPPAPASSRPGLTAPVPPAAEQAPQPPAEKPVYQFTDEHGVLHVTDDLDAVPKKYRPKVVTP